MGVCCAVLPAPGPQHAQHAENPQPFRLHLTSFPPTRPLPADCPRGPQPQPLPAVVCGCSEGQHPKPGLAGPASEAGDHWLPGLFSGQALGQFSRTPLKCVGESYLLGLEQGQRFRRRLIGCALGSLYYLEYKQPKFELLDRAEQILTLKFKVLMGLLMWLANFPLGSYLAYFKSLP